MRLTRPRSTLGNHAGRLPRWQFVCRKIGPNAESFGVGFDKIGCVHW